MKQIHLVKIRCMLFPQISKHSKMEKLMQIHAYSDIYIYSFIHIYILTVTGFYSVLNTKYTAQMDIPTLNKTNHVIEAALSLFCSSLICSSEHHIVRSLQRVMNRKKRLHALMLMLKFLRINTDTLKTMALIQ